MRTTYPKNLSNTSKNSAFQDLSMCIKHFPHGPTQPTQKLENQSKNSFGDFGPNCSTEPATPKLGGARGPNYFSGKLDTLSFKMTPSITPRPVSGFF